MFHSKYIIGLALDDINNRRLEAIVFAPTMTHKHAAELFGFGDHVVSAGFFQITVAPHQDPVYTVGVWGRSESLDIPSVPDLDLPYVRRALGLESASKLSREEQSKDFQRGRELCEATRVRKEQSGSGRASRGRR